MTASIFLDLSAYAGIAATAVLTINYLFGMLIGISYQRSPVYTKLPPHFKKIGLYKLHNITAYLALSVVLIHPTFLLFDPSTKFSFIDLVFPIHAPTQRLYVALGTISMFAIIVVIVTTQKWVKKRLAFRTWKNIHLISYGTGLLFIVHGIVMDPQLKNRPVDLLDAEKVASEFCLLILLAATFYRVRYEIEKKHSTTYFKLSIAEVINETADAKTFVLNVPKNRKKLFSYVPGQFIELKTTVNGKELKRAYSLSGNPYIDEMPCFTVKRIKDGLVSNYLNDALKAGNEISVRPPSGNFYTERVGTTPVHMVLFAGGSGITPIYSIIQSLLSRHPGHRLSLLYANREMGSIIFDKKLEKLQTDFPDRLFIVHVLSDAPEGWSGTRGRLDPDKIKGFLNNLPALPDIYTEYYICGPSPFMELVEEQLLTHQVPSEKIRTEKFVSIGGAEDALEVGHTTGDFITEKAVLKVRLYGAESLIECAKNQTLLDALLNAGIGAPYSCKEGICSTCKAKLTEGKVVMQNHASLTESDLVDKQILTCQAIPLSKEIKIDFDTTNYQNEEIL